MIPLCQIQHTAVQHVIPGRLFSVIEGEIRGLYVKLAQQDEIGMRAEALLFPAGGVPRTVSLLPHAPCVSFGVAPSISLQPGSISAWSQKPGQLIIDGNMKILAAADAASPLTYVDLAGWHLIGKNHQPSARAVSVNSWELNIERTDGRHTLAKVVIARNTRENSCRLLSRAP